MKMALFLKKIHKNNYKIGEKKASLGKILQLSLGVVFISTFSSLFFPFQGLKKKKEKGKEYQKLKNVHFHIFIEK